MPTDAGDQQPFRIQPDTPSKNPGLLQTARGFQQQKGLHGGNGQGEGWGAWCPVPAIYNQPRLFAPLLSVSAYCRGQNR
jgi:hypothetical protein